MADGTTNDPPRALNIPVPDPTSLTTRQLHDAIGNLEKLQEQALKHLQELHQEKFDGIALQFKERDERTLQLAKTQADALEAALKAAKELNVAQTEANKEANAKTEVAFGAQIKALTDKIDVATGRLDKGDGTTSDAIYQRGERRLDIGQVIAVVSVIVALLAVVLYALKK